MPRVRLPMLAAAVAIIGAANFVWFFAESLGLHGDALSGYVANGHYYVEYKGTYTEVGAAAWEWSRAHAISVLASWPLVMASGLFLAWRQMSGPSRGARRWLWRRPLTTDVFLCTYCADADNRRYGLLAELATDGSGRHLTKCPLCGSLYLDDPQHPGRTRRLTPTAAAVAFPGWPPSRDLPEP